MKIASAPNEERLLKLINQYFYSNSCRIENGLVFNGLGKQVGFVKKVKNKFEFWQ